MFETFRGQSYTFFCNLVSLWALKVRQAVGDALFRHLRPLAKLPLRLYVYAIIAKFLFVDALAPRRDDNRGTIAMSCL